MHAAARRALAVTGGLQGLAFWLLTDHWPDDPRRAALFVAGTTFLLVSALVLHFARSGVQRARLLALATGTGLVFAAVAGWVGWQLPGADAPHAGDANRVQSFAVAGGIALYALGPFLQIFQASGRLRFPYPDLVRHAWNNFFVAGLGLLFALALWIVLALWAGLFELIGVDFFEDLFFDDPFYSAITGAALAYGVAAGHESHRVIATLRGLTQALFRGLAPLLAAVTLAFLASLPFTGLVPLFEADSAASIVMGWIAAHLLLLNAIYLDGSEKPPLATPLRRLVEAGALLAPALAAIGLYAIWLRIEQHGLTPDRMFAAVISGVLALYSVGYATAVALRGEPWLPALRRVNETFAWGVIAICLALHTPLLDPIAWSLRSQLGRLASGSVQPEEFDYAFLRFELGGAGHAALEALGTDEVHAEQVERVLALDHYWRWQAGSTPASFARIPADSPWPDGLLEALRTGSAGFLQVCETANPCLVVGVDLDGDGRQEQLVAHPNTAKRASVLGRDGPDQPWKTLGAMQGPGDDWSDPSWLHAIGAGEATPIPPRHRDLELANGRAVFVPSY